MGQKNEDKGESKPFSCANPSGTVIPSSSEEPKTKIEKEVKIMETAALTKMAPDFEVPAYHEGGFKNVKLSDSFSKWIVLCFYPGDFTFV
jgi:hypothetical protein